MSFFVTYLRVQAKLLGKPKACPDKWPPLPDIYLMVSNSLFFSLLRVQAKRPANRKFVLINGHPGRVSSVDRPLFCALKRREHPGREDLSDLSSLARDRSLAARLLVLIT